MKISEVETRIEVIMEIIEVKKNSILINVVHKYYSPKGEFLFETRRGPFDVAGADTVTLYYPDAKHILPVVDR